MAQLLLTFQNARRIAMDLWGCIKNQSKTTIDGLYWFEGTKGHGFIASAMYFSFQDQSLIFKHTNFETALVGKDKSRRRIAMTHSLKKSRATVISPRHIRFFIFNGHEDWITEFIPQKLLNQHIHVEAAE